MSAAWWRWIVAAALLCGCRLAAAEFVLITDEEARRPRQFIFERSGTLLSPVIEVFGPLQQVPANSPVSFVVKFTARAGAALNMDSVSVIYMVRDPVDLTSRLRSFIYRDEMRVQDAIVPPGKHQLRISVQDTNGERRHMFYTFCISTCAAVPPR